MRNLTLLTDLYELTMVGGYFVTGKKDQRANFDYFFRRVPDDGGFCIVAGLEQVIEYIENIGFSKDDIAYLETLGMFPADALEYLKNFGLRGIYTRSPRERSSSPMNPSSGLPPHFQRPRSSNPPC